MKKIICLLLCIVLLGACKFLDTDDPRDISSNDRPFAIQTMQKIIKAFDEEDCDAILALFSEAAKENYDVEAQIEEAMEYYKGKSVDVCSDVSLFFTGSSGIKDNAYCFKSIRFLLYDWETDAGETFSFDVIYVLVDDEDPSQIGLSKILF